MSGLIVEATVLREEVQVIFAVGIEIIKGQLYGRLAGWNVVRIGGAIVRVILKQGAREVRRIASGIVEVMIT